MNCPYDPVRRVLTTPNGWVIPFLRSDSVPGWRRFSATSYMYPDTKELINDKNRRSLLVSVSASAESGKGGVIAEGYRGIPLRKGEKYDLSFYMKGASMVPKTVSLTLADSTGETTFSEVFRVAPAYEWRKYRHTFTATSNTNKAVLAITTDSSAVFWLDLKPKALIAFWPTNTMFVIISVSLFYNVAAANGTLEKISRSLLYACRKFPGMLPYALFAVAVILSVMGAAYFTVLAFLAPITLLICEESKMDKLTGAVAINCGALAGGDFPTAALGVIFRGLMDSSYEAAPELEAIDSFVTCLKMFGLAVLFSLILVTIFRFALPANRNIGKDVKFEKPEAYTTAQKQTLYLMVAMMAVVLVFPLLKLLIPGNAVIKLVAGKIDVGLVAFVFAVIALLMKLAPQKEIIARVPWNTILMIAGAGMLIAVAVEAGTIDLLSNWIGSNVPTSRSDRI